MYLELTILQGTFFLKEQHRENILQCFVVVIYCFDDKILYWMFSDAML